MSNVTLSYPLFDGEKIIENAMVTVENGIITSVGEAESADSEMLLMPGLIDAHTHMTDERQITEMLKNGVVATCDVCAPASLIESSWPFAVISSAGMTMGTLNGSAYVKKAIESGAKYIKVLLFEPNLMPKPVLKSICKTAHEYSLKVAVHATSVKAERLAVECGADILLHVPMKEELPEAWAREIAERGVALAPTLVMMEAFSRSGKNGYVPEHYSNAENAVRTLHKCGVNILAATDANIGAFAPAVGYGSTMHREMKLLCNAGLTPVEALASATGKIAKAFELNGLGNIAKGQKATFVLVGGRPDKDISAVDKIKQLWLNGEKYNEDNNRRRAYTS